MADARTSDSPLTRSAAAAAERDSKIEQLLLQGLDHYFAGEYERAITVWTRVLFLDRAHPRARAYIERARSALAERQRESEELVHTGVAALSQGEVERARAVARSLAERSSAVDEALVLLDRVARLERTAPSVPPAAARPRSVSPGPRPSEATTPPPLSRREVRLLPLLLGLAGLVGAVLYGLGAWDGLAPWRLRDRGAPQAARPPAEALPPVPSLGDSALARAQALYERGRLPEALRLLDLIRPGDPQRGAADALRATIQRTLLAAAGPASPASGPPQAPR